MALPFHTLSDRVNVRNEVIDQQQMPSTPASNEVIMCDMLSSTNLASEDAAALLNTLTQGQSTSITTAPTKGLNPDRVVC